MTEEQRARIAELLAAELRAAVAAQLAAGATPAEIHDRIAAARRRMAAMT